MATDQTIQSKEGGQQGTKINPIAKERKTDIY